ncbi:MAG TPA: hypothetical protein VLL08_17120 [Kineosporiaceae bacterium]|nr:hypothetical protein [Kineosporiaceae bacterium]
MALEDLISALVDHWDDVLAQLPADVATDLNALVHRITTSPDDPDAITDAALELAPLLLTWLPLEHPVAIAARSGGYRLSSGRPGVVIAPALSARLSLILRPEPPGPEAIWAAARRRLLGVPSLSLAEISARGQNPEQPALIRLERDDGTIQWPDFQFGPDGAPLALVLRINQALNAEQDPWGVADWWLGANAWLDSVPAAAIGVLDDEVLLSVAATMAED